MQTTSSPARVPPPSAAQLYASYLGASCKGKEACRLCGGPCEKTIPYTVQEPLPGFTRTAEYAKHPNNQFMCVGCVLWRRSLTTVHYLGGGLEDGQAPRLHSWLLTETECKSIRPQWALKNYAGARMETFKRLLNPPRTFCLMLRENATSPPSMLQHAVVNAVGEIKSDTELAYTLNNTRHVYTIYELEQAAVHGLDGRMPGAQALLRLFGDVPAELLFHVTREPDKGKRERGRPAPSTDPRIGQEQRAIKAS